MNKLFTASLALLGILFFNAELKAQITNSSFVNAATVISGSNSSAQPMFITIDDLDGDGKKDIVVPNSADNSISVFQNTCTPGNITSGNLIKTDYSAASSLAFQTRIADIDGDGKKDVILFHGFSSTTSTSFSVFRNITSTVGAITLDARLLVGGIASDGQLVDVDGDNKPDLVAIDFTGARVRIYRNLSVSGTISFSTTPVTYTTHAGPAMVQVEDLNADGKPDIVVTCYSSSNVINLFQNTTSGAGSISFSAATSLTGGAGVNGLALADLNNDGKKDIVVAAHIANNISIYQNKSGASLSFSAAATPATTLSGPQAIALTDFDEDGFNDIAVVNRTNGTVRVYRNAMYPNDNIAASSFFTPTSYAVGTEAMIFAEDIDGDGKKDIVASNKTAGTLIILRNVTKPSKNLIAYYPFSGNAGDSSGFDNHGTPSLGATLTTDRKGVANSAYAFNGTSNAKIEVPAPESLNTANLKEITMSCWFKPSGFAPQERRLLALQSSVNTNYELVYHYTTRKLRLINFNGPSLIEVMDVVFPTAIDTSKWNHAVVTMDSFNNIKCYLNGVLDTSFVTAPLRPSNPSLVIGNHRVQSWNFIGAIDEVKFYNKALDSASIHTVYEYEKVPADKIYYSKSTGALNDLATWGTNADGSGISPLNFDSAAVTYIVTNTTSPYLTGDLTINGTGSILKLGDGGTSFNLVVPTGNTITCDSVYVRNNITFTVQGSVAINKLGAETGSTVQLISTTPQNIIKGSYHNLSVSGGMKTLTGATTVRNALDMFTSIDCASNLFTIGTSVNQLGVINRMSGTIIGPLTRWFANTVNVSSIFPIGTASSYRGIQIAFPDPLTSGGTITASFVATAPGNVGLPLFDFPVFVDKVSPIGYWKLATAGGLTGNNYDVNVTAADITGVTDYTQLRLLKRNTGGAWTLVGSNASATGSNTSPTVYRNGVSGFNAEFGIGGDQSVNPLPVKLIIFTAKAKDKNIVNLDWKTSSEINNHHFDVERSADGKTFEKVGEVRGAGNTNRVTSYVFSDKLAGTKPVFFYRLKQVDNNGDFTYSDVISVRFEATGNLVLYPNPSNGILYVNGLQQEAVVSDLLGNEVMKIGADGMIDISELKQGVYFIRSGSITQKFIRN